MCDPIIPPFPFPELWENRCGDQTAIDENVWLIPKHITGGDGGPIHVDSAAVKLTNEGLAYPTNGVIEIQRVGGDSEPPVSEHNITRDTADAAGDDGVWIEEEVLQFDPEWAARFSKTIKRMKQKAHKARRRASWKKK